MEKVGLVWDLRGVPAHILRKNLLAEVGERCPLLAGTGDRPTPDGVPVVAPEPDPG